MTAAIPELARYLLALPPEASTVAPGVDALHLTVITVTLIGSVGVALRAAWFVVRYRRKKKGELTPHTEASALGETALIVGILGLFLAFWVVGFRQYVAIEEPPPDAMVVYVTAKQWMWKFAHPDGRRENDVLTVPVHKPVKLVMSSRDVIHSFYVPAFRVKQDVVPGRFLTAWFEAKEPGMFPILCAEFCGTQHGDMRGMVRVLGEADYAAYLREARGHGQNGSSDGSDADGSIGNLVEYGRRVATKNECFGCHSVTGEVHVGPSFARLYGRQVDLEGGRTVVADEAYLTRSMIEPNADVVRGFRPVMPTFAGRLEPVDAAALVELIKSLRDAPLAPPVGLTSADLDAGLALPPEGGTVPR